jgi:lipoprotein-anchoring transpeptidase ErfK/SrfK
MTRILAAARGVLALALVLPVAGTAAAPKPKAPAYPHRSSLVGEKLAHWAAVLKPAVVRARPWATARPVAKLDLRTSDETTNIVLVLEQLDVNRSTTWYRIRLPILPNNSTGWVPRSALSRLYAVDTHVYVNRSTFTLTLKKRGVAVFTTRVGVGRPNWPTPRGQFYVRDKLVGFTDPVYGPLAFGTSARSNVLTDWPGGGFIGIHGTNEPGILPGRVSHGCIRLRNDAILKLARLLQVGTPVTIT